jgi:hypothetical protein
MRSISPRAASWGSPCSWSQSASTSRGVSSSGWFLISCRNTRISGRGAAGSDEEGISMGELRAEWKTETPEFFPGL